MKAGTPNEYAELDQFIKGLRRALSSERCRLINKKTELLYLNPSAEALHQAILSFQKGPSAEGFINISEKVENCKKLGIGKFPRPLLSQLSTFNKIAEKEISSRSPETPSQRQNRNPI